MGALPPPFTWMPKRRARERRAGGWGVDSVLCHGRLDEDIPRGSQGNDAVHRNFGDAALRGGGGNDGLDGGGRDAGD